VSLGNRLASTARWRRLLAATAVGVLAAVVAVLGIGSPASAHGQFVSSEPGAGATVDQPLDRILLYFTERPTANAFFSVTSPTGVRVDRLWSNGDPRTLGSTVHEWFHQPSGKWVVRSYTVAFLAQLPIAYWPETGEYKVTYLSVATDGELVRGEFTFNYTGPVAPKPPDFRPQGPSPDPNLLAVASAAPTAPPDALSIEEQVAKDEAGPGLWILWVPIGIAVLVALTIYLFWKLRPQLVRELMVSRFGGRYAAPSQRRPLQLPTAVAERLPDLPVRLQERLPVRLKDRLPAKRTPADDSSAQDDE
jgi:methionine-rich copper-binding protein CopC